MADKVAVLTIRGKSEGLTELKKSVTDLGLEVVRTERTVAAQDSTLEKLARRYNDVYRIQQQYAQQQQAIERATKTAVDRGMDQAKALELQGMALAGLAQKQDQALQRVNAHTTVTRLATTAVNDNSKAVAANKVQWGNLGYQINDIATGLATGQRAFMIFAQQGTQVAQAVGGWGASFRAIASPVGLAVVAVAALAVGLTVLVARAASLESASRQIGVSLRAMGGAAGLSTAGVQSIIDQQSRQPGFGRSDITAATRQVLGNRNVRGADVGSTVDLARELALVNGQELPQALDALLPKLTSGAAGLRQLDEQYGILTADQLRYIDSLDRQGKQQDITRVGLDAMLARFKGEGPKAMSEFSRAVDDAGKALGATLDNIVKHDPVVQGLLKAFSATTKAAREYVAPTAPADPRAVLQTRLDDANRQFNNSVANNGARNMQLPGIMKEIEAAGAALDKFDAQQFSKEIDQIIAAAIRMGVALEDDKKKTDLLLDRLNPMGKAARDAAADMEALALALAKATDPDKARQLEDALRSVGQQAYQISSSSLDKNNDTTQAAVDAAEVARADRRARQLVEAEQRARADYLRLSPAEQGATDINRFIENRLREVRSQIGAAVRDLMQDVDAAAKHSLDIAKAFGQGLQQGYLATARAEVEEMVRTTAGLAGQEAELLKQKLQQAAAQAVSQLGQQNGSLLPQVEVAERTAAAEARGAAAIREAGIANQVYLATYEARARAELANNPVITAEYEKQKAILTDLITRQSQAQRISEAIALDRQFNPDAQLAFDISKIKDLAETGRISAKALQAYMTEAYIRNGEASDSWLKGATAGLLDYARQAQQVGGAVAQAIVQAFGAADDAIAKLILGRKLDVRQFLADVSLDLTRAFVRQSITGPVSGFLGNLLTGGAPALSVAGGVSGLGGDSHGGGRVGGGSSSPFGMLSGGGFNPFGIFGQGGSLGTFLQTPLFGTGGVFGASLASGGSSLGGVLGASGGVGGGLTIGSGLGALAGIGSSIFSFASGNPIGGVTGLLGAGLSLIPGVGQFLGPVVGILGGLLGGLFKSKPQYRAQSLNEFNPATGKYGGRVTFAENIAPTIMPGVGDNALKLLGAYGGSPAAGADIPGYAIWSGHTNDQQSYSTNIIGLYSGQLANTPGIGIDPSAPVRNVARAIWNPDNSIGNALPIEGTTGDLDALMKQTAVLLMKAMVKSGSVTGLSDTSSTIIKNFMQPDPDALSQALAWGKGTYDQLIRTDTVTAAEKAISGLKDSFQAAIIQAKDLGLATDRLVAAQGVAINKYAKDFGTNITDSILGIDDPVALQRLQIERAREDALREWDYLNTQYLAGTISTLVDRNKVNEFYDKQLQQVTSQMLTDLTDLQKRLLYGDLSGASPADVVTGTSGTYQATLAQAMAGDSTALARLSGDASDYVNAAQLAYGHDTRFADIRDSVLANINTFIGNGGVAGTGSGVAGNDNGVGATITALTTMVQQQASQIAALMEQNAILIAQVRRLVA